MASTYLSWPRDFWMNRLTPALVLRLAEMEAAFTGRRLDELSRSESQTRGWCLSLTIQSFACFQVSLASKTLALPKPEALAQ